MAGAFDVFFSYATRDHAAVERVARELTGGGLSVFLDRWYLTPGQPWPLRVVLTMRADFFGHALADRALSDQLQDAVVTIGPMTRDELADTIVKPAEAVNLTFEAGLAETILDDVGAEPGSLPLLEFLLEALWRERRGGMLQYDAYQRLGRVSGAIAHRAEEVFAKGLTEPERQAAQRLLIRMVRPGEGVEDTRQRAVLPQADPVAEATIRKLTDARLIVTERDAASGREAVEVAHEALIRGWQRLRGWVDRDREFLRTRDRIAAQARLWEDESRQPDRLLPPGRPLAEGEDLLTTRGADLEPLLVDYIQASAAAARAKEEARQAAQKRRLRITRLVAVAMGILAVVAVGGGTMAWWQSVEATRNAEAAQRNESRAPAALAENGAERGLPATAVRIAFAALPRAREKGSGRPFVPEAAGALHRGLEKLRERRRFVGHEGGVWSVAFSPDGLTLATGSWDTTARLWLVGQRLVDLACARVHFLPLSDRDKERFGVEDEWCTPEVSAKLRAELGMDGPKAAASPDTSHPLTLLKRP